MSLTPLAPPPACAAAQPARFAGLSFGRRFLLLWVLGLAWIVPALWDRTFLFALAAWDGILALGWIFDLAALPDPRRLAVERRWAGLPSLSVLAPVTIAVRNQSRGAVWCTVVDEVPAALRPAPPRLRLRIGGNSEAIAHYDVRPQERGDHRVGRVFLRYQSVLQLAERWAVADLRQPVRVYPNLEEARRQTIYLSRIRHIEREKRLLRQRGRGREFESLRDYRQGDEFRDICWTATARRARLITKVHQTERSQTVWLVLDCGRLMRARTGGLSKLDHAVDAALCLAQLALYSGDRVGLLAYGRQVNQRVGVGRGPLHLRRIVDQLALARAEVPEADHLRAASTLLGAQKRRALIVWLTDLAETAMTPEVIEAGSRMAMRHLLLFVVMGQPDLSEVAARRPDGVQQMYRTVAAQELVYRRELLLSRLHEHGALAIEIAPRKLSTTLLDQYLYVKERSLL